MLTPKLLGQAQLPNVRTALYTVPSGARTVIKVITLVNTDVANRGVNLYITHMTNARRIIPKNMLLKAGYMLETEGVYMLGSGDSIDGDATAGGVVDFAISGIEET